jgi:hypothetical protein
MRVKLEWHRPGESAPHKTEWTTAEETKKRLFVKLPSGYVKRVRKFDHASRPLSAAQEWAGAPGKSTLLLLTWDPKHYKVKP